MRLHLNLIIWMFDICCISLPLGRFGFVRDKRFDVWVSGLLGLDRAIREFGEFGICHRVLFARLGGSFALSFALA